VNSSLPQPGRALSAGFVEEICKYRETAHTVWMGGWPASPRRARLGRWCRAISGAIVVSADQGNAYLRPLPLSIGHFHAAPPFGNSSLTATGVSTCRDQWVHRRP